MSNVYFSPPFAVEISQQTHARIIAYIKRICPIPQADSFSYSRISLVRKRNNKDQPTYHLVAGEMKAALKKEDELKNSSPISKTE